MMTIRHLLLFGSLALLTGCATPCALPNELARDPAVTCFYQLTVTKIHMGNYHVTGTLPETVYKKGDKEKNVNTRERSEHFGKLFNFRVTDLDKLVAGGEIQEGNTYQFVRQGNSGYLDLLTGGPIK